MQNVKLDVHIDFLARADSMMLLLFFRERGERVLSSTFGYWLAAAIYHKRIVCCFLTAP